MPNLKSFEDSLVALIGSPTSLRPFVCNGSPLECNAFIVGFNPASASDEDFWSFWSNKSGFDKSAWYQNYLRERRERPLKPGKTRRNLISNTRRIIDWIIEDASPIKFLETNIYSAPSEEARDLCTAQRLTAPFDFLLTTIKPELIVAHGKDAIAYLSEKEIDANIIPLSHLSRGWSEVRARELGRKIAAEYGSVE